MSYRPLATEERRSSPDQADSPGYRATTSSSTRLGVIARRNRGLLFVLFFGLIVLVEFTVIVRNSLVCWSCEKQKWNILYSPASDAIRYEVRTFNGDAAQDTSEFWGSPSPLLDEKWHNLSSYAISRIPKQQAALLPNKTAPIPGDDQYYVAGLDVFHQLHCLNMIRQALHPDYYPERQMNTTYGEWHIRHCIDSVRQSLVCSADISVIVWQWSEEFQFTTPKGNIAHTCRNFDKIAEWAKERQYDFDKEFDYKVYMKDDIAIPTYYST